MKAISKLLNPNEIDTLNTLLNNDTTYSAVFSYFDNTAVNHTSLNNTLSLLVDLDIISYSSNGNKISKLFDFTSQNIVKKLLNDYGSTFFVPLINNDELYFKLINPLELSAYRDYFMKCGVIYKDKNNYFLNKSHHHFVEQKILDAKKEVSLQTLMDQLAKQNEIGELAESIALQFEAVRLYPLEPKLVSHIDVTKGYDILSYQDKVSSQFNKYIEVKTKNKDSTFFISKNELNTLNHYKENYSIYYVDINSREVTPLDNIYSLLQENKINLEPTNYLAKIKAFY